ncbi:hypothetical protein PG994_013613 [Apiospora phragmitis]|uniref:Uncharacterized protein n=1 Tax=Apiospora phragmitis TaxID=2905665 RepID=A0ABR1TAY9_9PEZI
MLNSVGLGVEAIDNKEEKAHMVMVRLDPILRLDNAQNAIEFIDLIHSDRPDVRSFIEYDEEIPVALSARALFIFVRFAAADGEVYKTLRSEDFLIDPKVFHDLE